MKEVARFLSEVGQLKYVKRSGWWQAGVKDPESVAEHVTRATILGRILAHLEKANPDRVTAMLALHEVGEARINDYHKMACRYLNFKEGEARAFEDAIAKLPTPIRNEFHALFQEFNDGKTKEAILAKDADLLEMACYAKELMEAGHAGMKDWIKNVKAVLKTKSARLILEEIEKNDDFTNCWWQGLKKLK